MLLQGLSRRYCGATVTHRQAHGGHTLANTKTRARAHLLGPCWAWPNTQALSFSLKHTHRKSEKMQLKKKLMRHISCIPAQFLAVKVFTTVAQESLTGVGFAAAPGKNETVLSRGQ